VPPRIEQVANHGTSIQKLLSPITTVESSGSSGVSGVSTPGWAPYFSWNLQTYLPGEFLGFPYSAPCPAAIPRLSYPPPVSVWQPVKRSRRTHSPASSPVWMAGQRAVTGYIGDFGDCTGFRFEKPRPGNLYGAWAAGDLGGFWGFISTPRKFF
jgi:hypothetical protein